MDLIRHYLAQTTGDVSDATVRRQLQAGGWVYKRFAKTVPLNAPSTEKKSPGGSNRRHHPRPANGATRRSLVGR